MPQSFSVDSHRLESVHARAGARVAAFQEGEIIEHYKRTNAAIVATEKDIKDWEDRTKAKIHDRVVSGNIEGCYAGAPVASCMTDIENATNKWIINVWVPFVKRWNKFVEDSRVGILDNHSELNKYDAEIIQHRGEFEARAGEKLTTPTPPIFKDEKSGSGGGTSSLIWILGVGFLAYLGLAYVAPALLGAATASKTSLARYRST